MKVATRLNLAILPAIVGLALLVALAYWGDRGRQAPEVVMALALVATVGSALLSWRSTRFVSRRVGALAAEFQAAGVRTVTGDAADEFEELARVRESVRVLVQEVEQLRSSAAAAAREADRHRHRLESLLEQVASGVAAQLQEARLALHILETSPFGALNENQEELVGAARVAADLADRELRRYARLVSLPTRRRHASQESMTIAGLLDPALAVAASQAEERGVTLVRAWPGAAPPVLVDRVAAQEALSMLAIALIAGIPPAGELRVSAAERPDETMLLEFTPGLPAPALESVAVQLALELLRPMAAPVRLSPESLQFGLALAGGSVWRHRSGP